MTIGEHELATKNITDAIEGCIAVVCSTLAIAAFQYRELLLGTVEAGVAQVSRRSIHAWSTADFEPYSGYCQRWRRMAETHKIPLSWRAAWFHGFGECVVGRSHVL